MRFKSLTFLALFLFIPAYCFAAWTAYPSSPGTVLSALDIFTSTYSNVTVLGDSVSNQTVSRSYDTVESLYDALSSANSLRVWKDDGGVITSANITDSNLMVRVDSLNSYVTNPDGTLTADITRYYYPVTVGGSSPSSPSSFESLVFSFNPITGTVSDNLFSGFDLSSTEILFLNILLIAVSMILFRLAYKLLHTGVSKYY